MSWVEVMCPASHIHVCIHSHVHTHMYRHFCFPSAALDTINSDTHFPFIPSKSVARFY